MNSFYERHQVSAQQGVVGGLTVLLIISHRINRIPDRAHAWVLLFWSHGTDLGDQSCLWQDPLSYPGRSVAMAQAWRDERVTLVTDPRHPCCPLGVVKFSGAGQINFTNL